MTTSTPAAASCRSGWRWSRTSARAWCGACRSAKISRFPSANSSSSSCTASRSRAPMPRIPFQKPKKVEWEILSDRYGRLVAEPFEKGYALTVGNSLRRTLLSIVPGAAVSWVKIDGVRSAETKIPGVTESTVDVRLNLKKRSVQVAPRQDHGLREARGRDLDRRLGRPGRRPHPSLDLPARPFRAAHDGGAGGGRGGRGRLRRGLPPRGARQDAGGAGSARARDQRAQGRRHAPSGRPRAEERDRPRGRQEPGRKVHRRDQDGAGGAGALARHAHRPERPRRARTRDGGRHPMRHGKDNYKLGRLTAHRWALFRNLLA